MFYIILLVIIMLTLETFQLDHAAYAGHQIWKITGDTKIIMQRLKYLEDHNELDVLGHDGEVRVKKEQLENVRNDLHNHGLEYDIIVPDLQQHLQKSDETTRFAKSSQTCTSQQCSSPLDDNWMTLEQIEWYLKYINSTFSPRVEVTSIGRSVEGRDIWMVHIKSSHCSVSSKSVWIEAGIHAREWLSYTTGVHVIHNLIQQCELSKFIDFYIVPSANPDGYKYSHDSERYWRKNRRLSNESTCIGVDLNRNWNHYFGLHASSEHCAEVYQGTGPFSEPETQSLSEAMKKMHNPTLVISLHSYGQLILYPWGFTLNDAPNTLQMIELGQVFIKSVKTVNNNEYQLYKSNQLYFTSGTTDDWAKAVLNVTFSYTIELPNKNSFAVPVTEIKGYVEEVWTGLNEMFKNLP